MPHLSKSTGSVGPLCKILALVLSIDFLLILGQVIAGALYLLSLRPTETSPGCMFGINVFLKYHPQKWQHFILS